MIVIGLVGGVASGKSLIAGLFEELGAVILDGDKAAHEVLTEPQVVQEIRNRWGEAVIGPDGRVDRKKVASIVFGPADGAAEELAWLEQLTHPGIRTKLSQAKQALESAGTAAAVLDAAVLIKAGWDAICDTIVYVDAPGDLRQSRAMARGWTKEEFTRREAAQEPLQLKRSRADWVIDNSGTVDASRAQVLSVWRSLAASP